MELYREIRPTELIGMYGQDAAVKEMTAMIAQRKVPHSILFTGPSGTGKTTAARILRVKLGCGDRDFIELDAASNRGIDDIREIRSSVPLAPMMGKTRVWLIDEAHKLTNEAQNALLKTLEDTPSHAYFFLATTDPAKLLPTIRTRCRVIAMKALADKDIHRLICDTIKAKKASMTQKVMDKIVETSLGSARRALVTLEACLTLGDESSQMECASGEREQKKGIEVALHLVGYKGPPKWEKVAALLKEIEDDPEAIRRIVMSVCSNQCLKADKLAGRAARVMGIFRDPLFDAGTAKAMLTLYCWEACQ